MERRFNACFMLAFIKADICTLNRYQSFLEILTEELSGVLWYDDLIDVMI